MSEDGGRRRAALESIEKTLAESPLFELRHGGQVWRLYADGRYEGFPDGTVILNNASTLVNVMRSLIREKLSPPSPISDLQNKPVHRGPFT